MNLDLLKPVDLGNKVLVSGVTDYSINYDRSISVTFRVGLLSTDTENAPVFEQLSEQSFYIQTEEATRIVNQPITKEDIGRSFEEINYSRIVSYLKESNQIK